MKGTKTILHIGGAGLVDQMHIERWDLPAGNGKIAKSNSSLILDQYTSFPEIFQTDSTFCNSTLF